MNSVFLLQAYLFTPGNPKLRDIMMFIFVSGIIVNLVYTMRGILRVKASGAKNLHWDLLFPMMVYSPLWVTMGFFPGMWSNDLVAFKLILIFAFALVSARLILSNLAFDAANPHKEFREFAYVFNIALALFQVIHAVNYFCALGIPSSGYLLCVGVALVVGYCHTFFSVFLQIQYFASSSSSSPSASSSTKKK